MKKEKYNIIDDIEIPETMCESWQKTLDIIAKIVNVPVALMMRVHKTEIEVFLKSSNKENIYEKGEKAKLNTGLYCEYVMDKKKPLLVPNALKDKKWNTNPDIELNMISYLGYPILWPDNKIFGTICVLDSKENNYSKEYKELIEHFRDSIEHNLKDIYDTKRIGDELVDRHTKNLSFLSSSAKTLIELPLEEDIYSHIAKEISKLADNAIVSICSYNLDSNKVKVREIVGISKTIDKLRKLLNMKIMGNEFEINDVAIKKLSMAKLHKVDNGFSDMSTKFSKLQSKAVEKLFNMGDVYAMGFCRKNKLFGNFTIFLRKGQTLVKKDLIETFAKQATVALERRRAEIKLSESENKFSKLFHSSPNIMALSRLTDGIIIDVNDSFINNLGYSRKELIGNKTSNLNLWVNSDDRARILEQIKKSEKKSGFECQIYSKTREKIDVLFSGEIITFDNNPHLVTTAIDITEKKKAEERLNLRYQYSQIINDVFDKIIKSEDSDIFLNFTLDLLGKSTDVSRVYIFKNFHNNKKTRNTHEWTNKGIKPQIDDLQDLNTLDFKYWFKTLVNNQIICASDIFNLPKEMHEILSMQGIKSILVVPLFVNKKFYGFIGFDECTKKRGWDKLELELLKTVSSIIALGIETFSRAGEKKKADQRIKNLNIQLKNYAKKLDLKIKRIDEKRVPLTDKEKLAFYGLVRYPHWTSKEIGDKIGMNRVTVNTIKNRLKKEGYFRTIYLPRFDMLGNNLISVSYMSTNVKSISHITQNIRKMVFKAVNLIPEVVYCIASDKDALGLDIHQNFSDLKNMRDSTEGMFRKINVAFDPDELITFPMESSRLINYFDFSSVLKRMLDINIDDSPIKEAEHQNYNINLTEKKVIYGLIKYPEETVEKLSKIINISVPTICKIRRKLMQLGVIKMVNLPDLKKIGAELLVLEHHRFIAGSKEYNSCHNEFLAVSSKTDYIGFCIHKDYTNVEECQKDCPFRKDKASDKSTSLIIPIEKINYFKFDCASLVKKMFDL